MKGSIGFGRESVRGPLLASPRTFPVLTPAQETCHICGRVDMRAQMHQAGWDDDYDNPDRLYVCSDAHPPPE